MKKSFYTIITFARLNTKRYFRDRLAIFFTVVFPLIFLFIFGSLFHNTSNVSFKVALINQSSSPYSQQIVAQAEQSKVLKIDPKVQTLSAAEDKMKRSELDATLVLPPGFGSVSNGLPSGQLELYYNQNNQQAASTLASILQDQFNIVNAKLVKITTPFTVVTKSTNQSSLTQFDYTFAGLLGFAILALGIFGPVNVFPELKKQGILRRLHTTPLKVWQYFMSNVLTQSIIGLFSISVMFATSVLVFHLKMRGSYISFAIFTILSIFTIYGIGLAIGGWAKNERQAAPLGNLISFPLMFLSGTFFPRFLMPEWLQGITNYLPLTPVIDGFRLIVTEGKSLFDVAPQIGLMAIWAVVIYFIAFQIFRWE
jgi:ABC-2 type transport system permease protein